MNLSRSLIFLTMFSLGAAEQSPTKMTKAYLELSNTFDHSEKSLSWSEVFEIDGEGSVVCPQCKEVMCQDSSSLQNGKKGLDEICEEHCKKECSFSSRKLSSAEILKGCEQSDLFNPFFFKPLSNVLASLGSPVSEGEKSTGFLSSPSQSHLSSDEYSSSTPGSPYNSIETQKSLLSLGGVGASTLLSKRKKFGLPEIKQSEKFK